MTRSFKVAFKILLTLTLLVACQRGIQEDNEVKSAQLEQCSDFVELKISK